MLPNKSCAAERQDFDLQLRFCICQMPPEVSLDDNCASPKGFNN